MSTKRGCGSRAQLDSRVDLAIVVLGVHDDHQVGGHTQAPAETPRSNNHLDGPCGREEKAAEEGFAASWAGGGQSDFTARAKLARSEVYHD